MIRITTPGLEVFSHEFSKITNTTIASKGNWCWKIFLIATFSEKELLCQWIQKMLVSTRRLQGTNELSHVAAETKTVERALLKIRKIQSGKTNNCDLFEHYLRYQIIRKFLIIPKSSTDLRSLWLCSFWEAGSMMVMWDIRKRWTGLLGSFSHGSI